MATDSEWNTAGSSTWGTISTMASAIPVLNGIATGIADQVTGTTPENPLHLAMENTQTQVGLTAIAVDAVASALTSEGSTLADFIARWTSAGDLVTLLTSAEGAATSEYAVSLQLVLLLQFLCFALEPSNTDGNPLDWWDSQVTAGRIEQSAGIICRRHISGEGGGDYLHLNPYWFYQRNEGGDAVPIGTGVGALLTDLLANFTFTPMSGGGPVSTLGFLKIVGSLLPVQY